MSVSECIQADETTRRLTTIPGVGPIIAATVHAVVPDANAFKTGRDFAAWTGLTARAHSGGGKERVVRFQSAISNAERC